LEEVRKFKENLPDVFPWDHYFDHISVLEGNITSTQLKKRTQKAIWYVTPILEF